MNRVRTFHFLIALIILSVGWSAKTVAQTPSPTPTPAAEPANPFAPQPAPPLPSGMMGSDTADPRATLKPGVYDAGEAASGIKHVMLLKKPDAFNLGTNNPTDPKVDKTLTTVLGIGEPQTMTGPIKLVLAGLGFANS